MKSKNMVFQAFKKINFRIVVIGKNQNNEIRTENSFCVFPNSANDFVTFQYSMEYSTNTEIVICDISGNKMEQFKINNNKGAILANIKCLNSGIYFVNLIQNNKTILKEKLLIIK
jgi:hypothetical protein